LVGCFDLGGASFQVAFVPSGPSTFAHQSLGTPLVYYPLMLSVTVPDEYNVTFAVGHQNYSMYVKKTLSKNIDNVFIITLHIEVSNVIAMYDSHSFPHADMFPVIYIMV
jgi:hypothetical protein